MFYHFRQNNSYGVFNTDDKRGLGIDVIIEADDWRDANDRAENIGIYFDGCDKGVDCPCCGNRWSRYYEGDEGDPVPSLYGEPLKGVEWDKRMSRYRSPSNTYIHYKDGRFVPATEEE